MKVARWKTETYVGKVELALTLTLATAKREK